MSDVGAITLPDGQRIPYARTVVSEGDLEDRRRELGGQTVRVLVAHREHGQQLLTMYEVPNAWLDAFLYDWQDAPGEGVEIIGVETGATSEV